MHLICAEKSQYQSLCLFRQPASYSIEDCFETVKELWHFEIKQECIQLDFWIQQNILKVWSQERVSFMNLCIYLLYILPMNLWNECIHIMVKNIVSVFFFSLTHKLTCDPPALKASWCGRVFCAADGAGWGKLGHAEGLTTVLHHTEGKWP